MHSEEEESKEALDIEPPHKHGKHLTPDIKQTIKYMYKKKIKISKIEE